MSTMFDTVVEWANHPPTCSRYCAIKHCAECHRPAVQGMDYCGHCFATRPAVIHSRDERGAAGDVVAVLGSLLAVIVVGVFLALAVIGKAEAAAPSDNMIVLEISPHLVVTDHWGMKPCRTEDPHGPRPCTWNMGPGVDGNGIGLSWYWDGARRHYVWMEDPRYGSEVHWVNGRLREWVRVNYDLNLSVSCMYWHSSDDTSQVVCANGNEWVFNF